MKYNTELTIEQREKNVKKEQLIALIMLIIGTFASIIGIVIAIKIYSISTRYNNNAYYKGMKAIDSENDSLTDVQELMNQIASLYDNVYIGDIERNKIDEYVCNALVSAYGDKYAIYMNPDETIANNNEIGSHIQGIGVLVRPEYEDYEDEYKLYLIDVYEESPAYNAGIRPGDVITHVNNKRLDTTKYDYSEAVDDVKGETGTTVRLTIIPKGETKAVEKEIVRANASVKTVRYSKLSDEVGYIIIRQFESETDEQFIEAVEYFKEQNISKIVFDVRNNPGGLKDSAVNILDYLLPYGVIIKELNSNGDVIETNMSDEHCVEFESVTIINSGTASAAELFTQSLIDYNKTTTIGKKSFGKGTICTTFNLSNGGSVRMSTGKYVTKSGIDLEKIGIEPDIEMELDKEKEKIQYKLDYMADDLIVEATKILENID